MGGRLVRGTLYIVFETRPVWEEFVQGGGLEDVPADNVPSDGRGLLNYHYLWIILSVFLGQLFQSDGGGQACRSGANDKHITFQDFSGRTEAG